MTENHKILIVDDNKLLCWGLAKIVSSPDLLVTSVHNGSDAIAKVRDTTYDWIFLDIDLPDISGLDLLGKIREISPDTNVIIISADDTDENRLKAIERGALFFSGKPLEISEIREILENVSDSKRFRKIILEKKRSSHCKSCAV